MKKLLTLLKQLNSSANIKSQYWGSFKVDWWRDLVETANDEVGNFLRICPFLNILALKESLFSLHRKSFIARISLKASLNWGALSTLLRRSGRLALTYPRGEITRTLKDPTCLAQTTPCLANFKTSIRSRCRQISDPFLLSYFPTSSRTQESKDG